MSPDLFLQAARVRCTVGEISDALEKVCACTLLLMISVRSRGSLEDLVSPYKYINSTMCNHSGEVLSF